MPDDYDNTRGRVAYEAYAENWKAANVDLPVWEDLPGTMQAIWIAVADKVCERFKAIY